MSGLSASLLPKHGRKTIRASGSHKKATLATILRSALVFGIVLALIHHALNDWWVMGAATVLCIASWNIAGVETDNYTNVKSKAFQLHTLFFVPLVLLSVVIAYVLIVAYGAPADLQWQLPGLTKALSA